MNYRDWISNVTAPARDSHHSRSHSAGAARLWLYVGHNIVTEYRYAEEKRDVFPEIAAELVRLKVDIVIVSGGTQRSASGHERDQDDSHRDRSALKLDHVEAGCVESLARPSGDVTGITILARELRGKRLELLKEAVPKNCSCRGSLRSYHSGQCTSM